LLTFFSSIKAAKSPVYGFFEKHSNIALLKENDILDKYKDMKLRSIPRVES
jgi:hypothetical protein